MGILFNHAWTQLGAIGLLVLFLGTSLYVLWKHHTKLMKDHKQECWGYTEKMSEAFKEAHEQQVKNSSILSELIVLIRGFNGKR